MKLKRITSFILAFTLLTSICSWSFAAAVPTENNDPNIVSERTYSPPTDDPNQKVTVTETIYDNGFSVIDTLTVVRLPDKARTSGTISQTREKEVSFKDDGVVTTFKIWAQFSYDDVKETVELTDSNSKITENFPKLYESKMTVEKESGGGILTLPWKNYKGSWDVASIVHPMYSQGGVIEILCYADGSVKTK